MSTQIIIALIPYAVPTIVVAIGYAYHLAFVHIPAQQRLFIEQWAKIAVLQAEQFGAGKTNAEKKQMAMDTLTILFKTFHLPLPSSAILSAFIEAAVNVLPPTTLQGGKSL